MPQGPAYGPPQQGPPSHGPAYGPPPSQGPPYGPPPGGGAHYGGAPQWGPPPSSGGSKTGLIIGLVAGALVLVLVAVVGVVWLMLGSPSSPPESAAPSPTVEEPQGSAALQEIADRGVLRIGLTNSPPFSWVEAGEATGSSPEMARAVFAELGVTEHDAVEVDDWNALEAALLAGEIDVVASSWIYDDEICRNHTLAAPDGLHPATLLVPSGNPEDLDGYEDVADEELTLGVFEGNMFMHAAEQAGVDNDQLEFPPFDEEMILDMVADGDIDAFASSSQWLRWMIEEFDRGDEVELIEPFTPVVDGQENLMHSGLIFADGQEDLLEDVDPVLEEMNADGRLLELGTPFGMAEDNLPPAGASAAEACSGS